MTTALERPRRTQEQRRVATRAKLLDAAIACLAERGYAGTSIPEVLRRAGLTNGAMWRHFPTKAALLSAVVPHAEASFAVATQRARGWSGLSVAERLDAGVAELFRFSTSDAFRAVIELLRASPFDPDLRDAMLQADRALANSFSQHLGDLIGTDLAAHPKFPRNLRHLALEMYGAALTSSLRLPAATERLVGEMQEIARELFDLG